MNEAIVDLSGQRRRPLRWRPTKGSCHTVQDDEERRPFATFHRSFSLLLTCAAPVALLLFSPARAQTPPSSSVTRSYSGQFIVASTAAPALYQRLSDLETNRNFVHLDATLVPVSCERIKQNLWRDLALQEPWRGKIFIRLYPARSAGDPIEIGSEHFRDGWQYQVKVPNVVERMRYVRAVVQVVLLEIANRTSSGRPAEIPVWLTEGLSRRLLSSSEIEIILPPPRANDSGLHLTSATVDARQNPLSHAHEVLCAGEPLSFQQLSWPSDDYLGGQGEDLYGSTAQVFVTRLLRLPDGRAHLLEMIRELPQHYNWQFALLKAFHADFQRPLDVEKWWTLQWVHFTGRELAQTWAPEESWQKLDETIRSAVQIRAGTNDLPLSAEVALQTIIRQWDRSRQTQALQVKVRELGLLRLRLAPEHVPLADGYRQTLTDFLNERDHTGFLPFRKGAVRRHITEATLRQLDELDAQRTKLRAEQKSPQPVQARSVSEVPARQ